MPITMDARDDGHILYVKMIDPIILSEIDAAYTQELVFRDKSNCIMHTVIDVSELKRMPPSVLTVGRRSPTLNHPRHGHLALFGASSFLQALTGALERITRNSQIKFCRSEEEAMRYLRKVIADESANVSAAKAGEGSKSSESGATT